MHRERGIQTLQTTALIHEAYLRLIDQQALQWRNRAHFFAIAATLMRRILVDHARARQFQKRGGGVPGLVSGQPSVGRD
jgi:RNA polymerase sigma factor (TIGR02999 family)